MHRRLISIAFSALAAAIVAGVLVASGGASAAPAETAANGTPFRQVLAAKLGAQLDEPADEVLAALEASKPDRATLRERLEARLRGEKPSKAERAERREQAAEKKQAFTESVAKELGVEPSAVTDAVQALVKERLDSLVEDGWLTAEQRDRRLQGGALGIAFLRTGAR